MTVFQSYFTVGFTHIADAEAIDHILYLLTLTVAYSFWQIRQVLVAITAFTIGHSITLALSVFQIVTLPESTTEMGVKLTILLGAMLLANRTLKNKLKGLNALQFILSLGFGLVHGMAFSDQLSALLGDNPVFWPLAGFNLGVEAGQLLIVAIILTLNLIVENLMNIPKTVWAMFCAGSAFTLALYLLFY